ncbi:uncharacterized protein LOC141853222 [Brevipalpus obovatus]|uniref:uncharacterized protein LOC141853222 n=1 Tax=Brevipalpus obovatus TaxID=246614 RepID=UPI003D9EB7A1
MDICKQNMFMITFTFSVLLTSILFHWTSAVDLTKFKDAKHGIKMGQMIKGCDDAKTNLEIDWNESPIDYTCFHPKNPLPIQDEIQSKEHCEQLPSAYMPQHYCMDKKIKYNTTLPTYGDHRPLWPVFGEYQYVPPQRWLHSIEHGSVVMLYHPCAHPAVVNQLRALVTQCIRKHVITPYRHLAKDRPIALVTWGCSLEMNSVNHSEVISFIRRTALKGPEGSYPKEGQFTHKLLKIAMVPLGSNYKDQKLCPYF